MAPAFSYYADRYSRAIVTDGELSNRGRGHGLPTKQLDGNAIIHLLVNQHAEAAAGAERGNYAPRAPRGSFGDDVFVFQLPDFTQHGVDKVIIGGAINLDIGHAGFLRGQGKELPVGEVAGEEDARRAFRFDRRDVFFVQDLDTLRDDFLEMR